MFSFPKGFVYFCVLIKNKRVINNVFVIFLLIRKEKRKFAAMNWVDNIKRILAEKGLKRKDLAAMIGVTHGRVSAILTGDAKISTLERIASALNVPMTELFSDGKERELHDEEYRDTHVHGYIRIGKRIIEVKSMEELEDAVVECHVNYLR